ncbi:hypothetical protein P5V15_001840 [Pogonomyrmex californicus]
MDFFDTRYFRINKLLLSSVGLWPYQTPFMKLLSLLFAIYGIVMMTVPETIYLIKHPNMDVMFELMPNISGTLICIAKIICLIRNTKMFEVLLQQTHEDWDNLLTSEETQILTSYAENGRKFTLVYSISISSFVFCYVTLPLADPILDIILPLNETRQKKMPHLVDFIVVDQEKHYYALLLNMYIGYTVCVLLGIATDTMYVLMVVHICGMYDILCHRLENLMVHDELRWIDNNYTYKHDEIGRRVRRCIQLHERIRLFIETMESTFALFLLSDVGIGFLLQTSSCIMIVVRTGRSSEIMRYLSLAILQSCRLFFNSWAGQEVTDHSVGVSMAAYNGIWYNAPIKIQKLLVLLIARSQKASRITIAKLYVINLEGFNMVMRTSVSYCTVMISLREQSDGA